MKLDLSKVLGYSHCKKHGLVRGSCEKCKVDKLVIAIKCFEQLEELKRKKTNEITSR